MKVSVSQSGRYDGAESGSLWGLGEEDEVLVRPPETHMAVRDLLVLLQNCALADGARHGMGLRSVTLGHGLAQEAGSAGAAKYVMEHGVELKLGELAP